MGEFCNKAGLKQHQYRDYDFKNLDELGGMEEVKQALTDNVIDVCNPEIRKALLANRRAIPGGIILEGPAGTGKTTMKGIFIALDALLCLEREEKHINGVNFYNQFSSVTQSGNSPEIRSKQYKYKSRNNELAELINMP